MLHCCFYDCQATALCFSHTHETCRVAVLLLHPSRQQMALKIGASWQPCNSRASFPLPHTCWNTQLHCHKQQGIIGLVAEYTVAIGVTRVRFPDDALASFTKRVLNLGRTLLAVQRKQRLNRSKAPTMATCQHLLDIVPSSCHQHWLALGPTTFVPPSMRVVGEEVTLPS